MRRFFSGALVGALLAASLPGVALAQTAAAPATVDRVVAVVGDTVLLQSDLRDAANRLRATGRFPEGDEAAVFRQIAQRQIDELILIQAARAAGVEIRDAELEETVERQVAQDRQRFSTQPEFEQALAASGYSLEGYRRFVRQQLRDEALRSRFIAQRLREMPRPAVADSEIVNLFERQRAQLPPRAATISFREAAVRAVASDSAKAVVRARADSIVRALRAGANFDSLARQYSGDPGSRERGGDLGWFRHGQMVRAFEQAVYSLAVNQISEPVETEYGFHIIQLRKARGPERQARHILLTPPVTPADQERARLRADSLAALTRAGARLDTLLAGSTTDPRERIHENILVERLPPAYAAALAGASTGAVVGPFVREGTRGPEYVVVQVTGQREAGQYSVEEPEVRERIRTQLQEQRQVERLLEELRRTVYVNVLI